MPIVRWNTFGGGGKLDWLGKAVDIGGAATTTPALAAPVPETVGVKGKLMGVGKPMLTDFSPTSANRFAPLTKYMPL